MDRLILETLVLASEMPQVAEKLRLLLLRRQFLSRRFGFPDEVSATVLVRRAWLAIFGALAVVAAVGAFTASLELE